MCWIPRVFLRVEAISAFEKYVYKSSFLNDCTQDAWVHKDSQASICPCGYSSKQTRASGKLTFFYFLPIVEFLASLKYRSRWVVRGL